MIRNKRFVKLGAPEFVDRDSIIGYSPSRKIESLSLVIGRKAIVRSGSVIYLGSRIGKELETGHNVVIREENRIGDKVKVWSNTIIDYQCKIGHRVKIHSNCYVAQLTEIEDDVFVAPGVALANEKYPTGVFSPSNVEGSLLKRGAKVGMNSTILPGLTIGENAVVGAGSVVTEDVPADSLAYGVPAKVIRTLALRGET